MVDAANPAYTSSGNVLFNKNLTTLVQYPRFLSGPYTIPNSVTNIGYYAFVYSEELTSISMGNGVTTMGLGAFAYCDGMTNVTFSSNLTNISFIAFADCYGLTNLTIPGSVRSIDEEAFFDCTGLQGLYFKANAPTLGGTNVFEGDAAIVYYLLGTTGWSAIYGGLPTALYGVNPLATFNNGAYVVTNVSAGLYHSLFLKSDGSLWGMGENGDGQLGLGATSSTNHPSIIATNVVAMAGGGFHSLFVKGDGSLWAMGDNQYGELGDGTFNSTNQPEMILPAGVVAVAAGVYHSLFLKRDSSLWGMGYNHDGQLGVGSFGPSNQTNRPVYIDTNVTAIAAGNYHSLYIKNGELLTMGYNDDGQLGNANNSSAYTPVPIASATAVAAKGNHSLFLNGGTLWAMGDNSQGEFGNGTYNNTASPEQIATNVSKMAAGSGHTLYMQSGGSLLGMGQNTAGELGDGTYTTTDQTEMIVPAYVTAAACGDQHSLFLAQDGSLWGMGNNGGGELGDGTYNNTNQPEQIIGPIVANGDFEMGNFDGWTLSSAGFNTTITTNALSGLYCALFSKNTANLAFCILSQTLPTRPGGVYLLSLWVNGISNGGGLVNWNGNELVNENFNPGWTQLSFVVTATSTSTLLKFVTTSDTTAVDDISVTPLLNYNKIMAQLLPGNNVRLSFTGNVNANYALDRTFNLTPPVSWAPLATNVTDGNGFLAFTNTAIVSTNNFWRIRSVP